MAKLLRLTMNQQELLNEQLRDLLKAYDEFMASDKRTNLDNPAWERLSDEFHITRILLFGNDEH